MTSPSDDKKVTELHPVDAQPASEQTSDFAENLQLFWFKYRTIILWALGLILVSIVGKEAYDMYAESRAKSIASEYAACGNNADKLRQFASEHSGNTLAGIALLRVADDLYSQGKYIEAQVQYDKSLPAMGEFPGKGRARLGSALSLVLGGKGAEGEAALKKIIADEKEFKGLRSEAAYQLSMVLAEAGKNEEAVKVIDQLVQIDMVSGWARRAMMIRPMLAASLPAPAASAAPVEAVKKADEPLKLSLPTSKN